MKRTTRTASVVAAILGTAAVPLAVAAPATYKIDPAHTAVTFETDHMGGMSIIRGKFTKADGTVVYDREAKAGTVDIAIDTSSVDFGLPDFEKHVKSADMLDNAKFPTATFKGKLAGFKGDVPSEVQGDLTLHGVTKPVTLKINQFLCKPHPMRKVEACGADASAMISRKDFGINYGEQMGFKMDMKLMISIEALKEG